MTQTVLEAPKTKCPHCESLEAEAPQKQTPKAETPPAEAPDELTSSPCICAVMYVGQIGSMYYYYAVNCANPNNPLGMYSPVLFTGGLGCGTCAPGENWCTGDPMLLRGDGRPRGVYMKDADGILVSSRGLTGYHDPATEFLVPGEHTVLLDYWDARCQVDALSVRYRGYLIKVTPPSQEEAPLIIAVGLEVEDAQRSFPVDGLIDVVDDFALTADHGGVVVDVLTKRRVSPRV